MFRREKGHTLSSFIENRHDDEDIIEETYQDDYYNDGSDHAGDTQGNTNMKQDRRAEYIVTLRKKFVVA